MASKGCGCGDTNGGQTSCGGCADAGAEFYWCESCQRTVPEKRCPYCGLKARKGGPPQAQQKGK